VPLHELQGIEIIKLEPGETKTVSFSLSPRQIALIDNDGNCILEPGQFRVSVGGRQPDSRSQKLAGTKVLTEIFTVTGEEIELEY
jgi:beta-glucosidase